MKITLKKLALAAGLTALVFCFAAPQPAHAFGQDAAGAANLLAYVSPVMKYLFDTAMSLVKGLVFLVASAWLLQTAVDNSPQWIDIKHSTFVNTGLQFTTAMADILLIAVFIAIAIGYVFKMETFNSEKALPKFFIVALLVHFAPLFVEMLVDVSNILLKSVMVGKEGIFTSVFINNIGGDIILSILSIALPFGAAAGASVLGSFGTLANLGAVVLALANLFIGIPRYIMQNMVLDILGGLVFSYAMFFLTRVFVIQLLAILSPLAILSAALPQTKKWYDMWMQWLTGWCLGGILMLFLLTLGLTCLDVLGNLPTNTASFGAAGTLINWNMKYLFYWFAVAIYMMTVDFLCLAAIPALAKQFSEKMEGGVRKMGQTVGSTAESKMRGRMSGIQGGGVVDVNKKVKRDRE